MKKRIFVTCSAILSTAVVASAAFAALPAEGIFEEVNTFETSDIKTALENSNVLKSVYNIVSKDDDPFEEKVQTYALENETTDINVDEAKKLYDVLFEKDTVSISEEFEKENKFWLVPQEVDDEMLFVHMKIADSLESATKKINALNISKERKDKMIERAAAKADKWCVDYIVTENDAEAAKAFVNENAVLENLASQGIDNVLNLKYINVSNNRSLAVWVQTEEAEYIMPYTDKNDLTANTAYKVSDFANAVAEQ